MMESGSPQAAIRRSIERGGYVRRHFARLSDRGAHKEWLHFSICSRELDLFVNFSWLDEARAASEVARLIIAVRTRGWDGDLEHFEAHALRAQAGGMNVRLGENYVSYAGGSYTVVARLRKRAVRVQLSLEPVTIASQVNNIALGDAPPMHWFVVPKLLASGHVTVGATRYELENVPAYHDHNWGFFRWGQDFSWVWGYGHAHTASSPWVFAFDRLSNRARDVDLLRGILVWKGARQHRLFGGSEIRLRTSGTLRTGDVLRLPRVMALLRPEQLSEVPERFYGRAEGRGDVLEFEFRSQYVCQLIAPNDADLGLTVVNEVAGDLTLEGCVRGEPIALSGRAMFEFLRD